MELELELVDICKAYGQQKVLSHVNLKIYGASTYCLLGRNGAGKSTLINIITHIILPSQGVVTIDYMQYERDALAIKKRMGVQSEYNQLIGELDGYEYLHWIGLLYEMNPAVLEQQIDRLLGYFFDKSDQLNKPVRDFSVGMQKKLSICAAVLHKPELLVLDEPFANLDPVANDKLCTFLNAYRKDSSRILFVSSHDLMYVDRIATHIGVISDQKLVFDDTVDHFLKEGQNNLDSELLKYLNPEAVDTSLLQTII